MKISQAGINLIKKFEGVRLQAYKPVQSEKYWTIGYGHYGADVSEGQVITQEQADELLAKDIEKFEAAVNKYSDKYNFTQGQFDALVSFAFNCGISNLNKLVDNGNRNIYQIASHITQYNKAGGKVLKGLVTRRQAELDLFNSEDNKVDNTNTSEKTQWYIGQYIITASSLRIRSGIGIEYSQVGSVKKGDIVGIQSLHPVNNQIWGKLDDNKYICIVYDSNTLYAVPYIPVDVQTYSLKLDAEIPLSKNFKVKEFKCKDGSDTILIDSKLIYFLQIIRDHFNKPVIINSAYRTQQYNTRVGGAKNSYHKLGRAADIHIDGIHPKEIAAYAESIGMLGIGEYPSFTHVDTRDNKSFWYGSSCVKRDTFLYK